MTLKELIDQLNALELDPDTKVWVMDNDTRVEPEVFTHRRLGVVIM